jgi:two-component system response regulator FixJ
MIYVVDDDSDVLGSLRFLLETDGFDVRTFRSAAALLNGSVVGEADCIVIDYKMPACVVSTWRTGCGTAMPAPRSF